MKAAEQHLFDLVEEMNEVSRGTVDHVDWHAAMSHLLSIQNYLVLAVGLVQNSIAESRGCEVND